MSQISVTYTGDGTSVIFTIPFPYIDQSDVQVLVNGSQVTAFTFVNATTIQFSVAPTNGALIEIRRSTAADISNQFFANSSIRSQSLNENFQQTLFVAEEAREIAADAQAGSLVPGSIGTSALADGAVTDAKVASGAAIAGTKISPNFGSQTVVTTGGFTGNLTGTASAIADNTVTSAKIVNGSIVNADISSSASIAGTKIAPNFGSQTITTTGVIRPALGTAAAPSITFTGNTDTGVFSPGADQVAVATNGSEHARIDSSGRILVGTSTSQAFRIGGTATFEPLQQLVSTVGASILRAAASPSNLILAAGSAATPVASQTEVGRLCFNGYDGSNYTTAALIVGAVDGTPGADNMPGRLVFSTTAGGASSPTERMRIGSGGLVRLAASAGLSISSTGVTSPATADGNVFSGTYTPTLTNGANVSSSTATACHYMRVGNVITVGGQLSITATAANTDTQVTMTLPVASTFSHDRILRHQAVLRGSRFSRPLFD
jgi:hypothetical protein